MPTHPDRLTVDDADRPRFTFNFGQIDAALATMHGIAATKRTAFQARLKNFHRLGFPRELASTKGRASSYTAGMAVEMALALEMTQLGLPPDRIIHVLTLNSFRMGMAIRMAARELIEAPQGFDLEVGRERDPMSMFVYFDPSALRSLTLEDVNSVPAAHEADDAFFYGGEGVVRIGITNWTSGYRNRLSFINVTAMADWLAAQLLRLDSTRTAETLERNLKLRRDFFAEVEGWAKTRTEVITHQDADYVVSHMLSQLRDLPEGHRSEDYDKLAHRLSQIAGFDYEVVRPALERLMATDRAMLCDEEGNNVYPEA